MYWIKQPLPGLTTSTEQHYHNNQIMESFVTLPAVAGISLGRMLELPWWSGGQNTGHKVQADINSSSVIARRYNKENKTETLQRRAMTGSEPTMTLEDPCLESKRSCDAHSLMSDSNDSSFSSCSVSWQFKHPLSLYHSCNSVGAGPSSALQQQTVLITEGEHSKCEQI